MKIKVPTVVEVDIHLVRISASVNYGVEEIPKDFPGRTGDTWNAEVEIDTGKILNWPHGRTEKMYLTVRDCGSYALISSIGHEVAVVDRDYVPNGLVPGKYGDTIELEIAADGTITNWPRKPDVSDFFCDH